MLKGVGFTDADLAKPLIGVATTWIETMPCNLNHRRLAGYVKQGIRRAGGTPIEFNTIAVSDGVSMGTVGMRASLVSREVIADSIELVARGHLFDGLVCIVGCDKTIPGGRHGARAARPARARALQRLDRAGPVPRPRRHDPGRFRSGRRARGGEDLRPGGARARERRLPGRRRLRGTFHREHDGDRARLPRRERAGPQRIPANHPGKPQAAVDAGELAMRLVEEDTRPSQMLTREAFENAIAAIAATGGSTNGVLHLLAIAAEAGIPLEIDDFDTISSRTPIVADIKPGGRYVATDLFKAGGVALVARELVQRRSRQRATRRGRRALAAPGRRRRARTPGQDVVVSSDGRRSRRAGSRFCGATSRRTDAS